VPYCDLRFFSRSLQKQTAAIVLLPEPDVPRPWSTLYLLHGLSDDHTIWSRRTSIERYVEGLPLVVVMPDGGRSFYCDAVEGPPYGQAIGEDLPVFIESIFPVRRERGGRAIAGLSMGGYGAFRIALDHPERFCAASSHSGALGFGHFVGRDEEFTREFRRVLGSQMTGGPNDLFSMVEKADRKSLPALRFDCGDDDHLLRANTALHEHLDKLGISHIYEQFPGGHTWAYWDEHIRKTLRFVGKQMGVAAAT
jgi:S-formylglutathione hydrolase FrmB